MLQVAIEAVYTVRYYADYTRLTKQHTLQKTCCRVCFTPPLTTPPVSQIPHGLFVCQLLLPCHTILNPVAAASTLVVRVLGRFTILGGGCVGSVDVKRCMYMIAEHIHTRTVRTFFTKYFLQVDCFCCWMKDLIRVHLGLSTKLQYYIPPTCPVWYGFACSLCILTL